MEVGLFVVAFTRVCVCFGGSGGVPAPYGTFAPYGTYAPYYYSVLYNTPVLHSTAQRVEDGGGQV